ncbi:hypothetical protein Hanom_Chr08g00756421 [Helianthus anomalus]
MADVARSHGGDGGNEPPNRNSKRIRTGCESSQPKKTRGKANNKKLYIKFRNNKNQPLPVEISIRGGQYKFVGVNAQDIIRMISNEVARVAPFYHRTWQRVPDETTRDIYTTIYQYFDLVSFEDTSEWPGVQLGIQAECQRSYKARKSKYKSHYNTYEDVETAKNNPSDDFASEPERWIEIIDRLYQDPGYINQCEKKTDKIEQNCAIQLPGHTNPIEGFKSSHWKEDTGWVNETASLDHVYSFYSGKDSSRSSKDGT